MGRPVHQQGRGEAYTPYNFYRGPGPRGAPPFSLKKREKEEKKIKEKKNKGEKKKKGHSEYIGPL